MPDPRRTMLDVRSRAAWRAWLRRHHAKAREIWLVYHKKESGIPRVAYNDAVDEALCFGWIDSTLMAIDEKKFAQRYTPRRRGSTLSEMNKERVRRLIRQKRMTAAGMAAIRHLLDDPRGTKDVRLPPEILRALKNEEDAWKHFQKFPVTYRRIRIGWIVAARHRPEAFRQRLAYFVRMTAKNKRFGMVQ